MPLDLGVPQIRAWAWSPDGETAAFLAAPEQGLSGMGRLDATFNLYLMNPDGSNMRPLIESIRFPGGLTWTPAGRNIIFSAGSQGFNGGLSFWLVDVETGKRTRLPEWWPRIPEWSPDGQQALFMADVKEQEADTTDNLVSLYLVEIDALTSP